MMDTMFSYSPENWHWQIATDGRIWSSAANAWVSSATTPVTQIGTIEELDWVLRQASLKSPLVTSDDVDAERDQRIAAGFAFGGHRFQSRPGDRENIAGASTAALAAIVNGAERGEYRWHGGGDDFAWISENNMLVPMDAQTMFALGQAAMAHKQAMIFAARTLKDMPAIPDDFAADTWWPATGRPETEGETR